MAWMCVLWQLALRHRHPQVVRASLQSFFQRNWQGTASSEAGSCSVSDTSTLPAQDRSTGGEQQQAERSETADHPQTEEGPSSLHTFSHAHVPFVFVVDVLLPVLYKDVHKGVGSVGPEVLDMQVSVCLMFLCIDCRQANPVRFL